MDLNLGAPTLHWEILYSAWQRQQRKHHGKLPERSCQIRSSSNTRVKRSEKQSRNHCGEGHCVVCASLQYTTKDKAGVIRVYRRAWESPGRGRQDPWSQGAVKSGQQWVEDQKRRMLGQEPHFPLLYSKNYLNCKECAMSSLGPITMRQGPTLHFGLGQWDVRR